MLNKADQSSRFNMEQAKMRYTMKTPEGVLPAKQEPDADMVTALVNITDPKTPVEMPELAFGDQARMATAGMALLKLKQKDKTISVY